MKTILAIQRVPRYSPNSVAKDAAILDSVCRRLRERGDKVVVSAEDNCIPLLGEVEMILSMARHDRTLAALADRQREGVRIVNRPEAVSLCCRRSLLNSVLLEADVPLAPAEGEHGYWVKRADGVAEGPEDVVFAADSRQAVEAELKMRARGAQEVLKCAHLPGDLVKFYGVHATGFFHFCYPGDDGQWKFGDERRNGRPHHYPFDSVALHQTAERAAAAAGIEIYGGDCIVDSTGRTTLIDFNDWPSFSRCREEAAEAIVKLITTTDEQ